MDKKKFSSARFNSRSESGRQKFWNEGLTVDTVIFAVDDGDLKVLLIKRPREPFKGTWTLPGGFLERGEKLVDAATRILSDKAGIRSVYMEQLYTFDKKGRDPRGDIITVSYFALSPIESLELSGNKDENVQLFSLDRLSKIGFDHKDIIEYARTRLRFKLEYTNVAFSLLPKEFTLSQLRGVYEAIFNKGLDKRNFLKKYLSMGFIRETGKLFPGGRQRPAKLYRFVSRKPAFLKRFF